MHAICERYKYNISNLSIGILPTLPGTRLSDIGLCTMAISKVNTQS